MDSLGTKLRRQRRRLGLTLDELAGRTAISKPYLSLIETGRVPNPPSDEKLRRLEQVLGFPTGELLSQAHIQRTPRDVRAVLAKLLTQRNGAHGHALHESLNGAAKSSATDAAPINLDDIFLSGVLQELVEKSAGNVEQVGTNAVPVINRVSAGYPRDFTDLSYPKGAADDYVSCPDLHDQDAFAARVHGDSMSPKYRQDDIVIFSPAAGPKSGDDCFVRFDDGQTTFKRVFFENDDSGSPCIRLQPRNEKYRPQTVPSERVTGLYKAMFRYQRVDQD
jgi:phage repressor protein C with HTH and peptisase S24 domain